MPCGCHSVNVKSSMGSDIPMMSLREPIQDAAHEVLPGESCIFCACKHISVAYSDALSDGPWSRIIGELELARRHTLAEFGMVAASAGSVLYHACLLEKDAVLELLPPLAEQALDAADNAKKSNQLSTRQEPAMNPFMGFIHLFAAWRLASEIGYMPMNRAMIIGDLELAGEQLVRFGFDSYLYIRNLRHRVESTRAADFSEDWNAAVKAAMDLLQDNIKEYSSQYGAALGQYLLGL